MGFTFYFSILFLIIFGGLLHIAFSFVKRTEAGLDQTVLLLLGLLALSLLLVPFRPLAIFYQTHILFPLLVVPVSLALSALLILQAFRHRDQLKSSSLQEDRSLRSATLGMANASLVVSGLLLMATTYHLYWFLVWDSTYDPIGLLFFMPLLAAAVACGFGLAIALPGRLRTARLVLLFAFPLLVFETYDLANHVDFRELSSRRLELVGQAVETFYTREGRYPDDLRQLVPRYFLRIPEPVFIYGQDWCYQVNDTGFQLAYLTRDHWSSPYLSARAYHTQDNPDALEHLCSEQVGAQQLRQPWSYWHDVSE